jgi:hypothetical protein
MSFYVKRTTDDGRHGWTGPIRSRRQADREAAAWTASGWDALVFDGTPEVRAAVRAWQRERDIFHGRV